MMRDRGRGLEGVPGKSEESESWNVQIYFDSKRSRCRISKTRTETKEEELTQDQRNKRLNEYIQKSFGWMSKQALDAEANDIRREDANQKEKAVLLDSTFLLSQENREDFHRVVRLLADEYRDDGLEIECTRPESSGGFSRTK